MTQSKSLPTRAAPANAAAVAAALGAGLPPEQALRRARTELREARRARSRRRYAFWAAVINALEAMETRGSPVAGAARETARSAAAQPGDIA